MQKNWVSIRKPNIYYVELKCQITHNKRIIAIIALMMSNKITKKQWGTNQPRGEQGYQMHKSKTHQNNTILSFLLKI